MAAIFKSEMGFCLSGSVIIMFDSCYAVALDDVHFQRLDHTTSSEITSGGILVLNGSMASGVLMGSQQSYKCGRCVGVLVMY